MINSKTRARFAWEIKERFEYIHETFLDRELFKSDLGGSTLKDKFLALHPLLQKFETELLGDLNGPYCTQKEALRTRQTAQRFENSLQRIFDVNSPIGRNKELDDFFNYVRRSTLSRLMKTIIAGGASFAAIFGTALLIGIFSMSPISVVMTIGSFIAAAVGALAAFFTYRFNVNVYEDRGKHLKAKLKEVVADSSLETYLVNLSKRSENNVAVYVPRVEKEKPKGLLDSLFGTKEEPKVTAKAPTITQAASGLFNKLGGQTIANALKAPPPLQAPPLPRKQGQKS